MNINARRVLLALFITVIAGLFISECSGSSNILKIMKEEYWPAEPLSHENYAYIDVENDPLIPIAEFRKQYTEAVEHSDAWIQNPIDVGLRLAGYPNLDRPYPDKVFVYYTQSSQATVIVVSENLMDDSIKDHEKRIDLVRDGKVWRIEWAGYRQRCYRNPAKDWIAGRCP